MYEITVVEVNPQHVLGMRRKGAYREIAVMLRMPAKVLLQLYLCGKRIVDRTSTSTGLKVFSTIKNKVYATARKASEIFKEKMKIVFDDYWGNGIIKQFPK